MSKRTRESATDKVWSTLRRIRRRARRRREVLRSSGSITLEVTRQWD